MRAIIFIVICSVIFLSCSQRHEHHQQLPPTAGSTSMALMLTKSQINLANITMQAAGKRPIGKTLLLNSRLVWNESQRQIISSRVTGRIEKLYLKETGKSVKKGEPLYTIYSEGLLTIEQEYLMMIANGSSMLADAAEKKLERYGLSPAQIAQLKTSEKPSPAVTFLSPASGTVTELRVSEGSYVTEGTALYQLDSSGDLWLEAELYSDETSFVRTGDAISVNISGIPEITTTVKFLSPEFRGATQVVVIRADIPNAGGTLKPGMQAQTRLMHSTRMSLSVPSDAVIRSSDQCYVFVTTGENTFEPRIVKTGTDTFTDVEITGGLKEGEHVVITGAYLLYSEFVLKKGSLAMLSHHH